MRAAELLTVSMGNTIPATRSPVTFREIRNSVVAKMARRLRIGWFDYSSDSYDMRVAGARACRIHARLQGRRLSLRECL